MRKENTVLLFVLIIMKLYQKQKQLAARGFVLHTLANQKKAAQLFCGAS